MSLSIPYYTVYNIIYIICKYVTCSYLHTYMMTSTLTIIILYIYNKYNHLYIENWQWCKDTISVLMLVFIFINTKVVMQIYMHNIVSVNV